jgi:hypothetical protein
METSGTDAVAAGASIVAGLVVLVVFLAVYVFLCYCLKRICEKCGKNPGVLIWLPILQLIPLLELAGMAVWMIILFFIPIVGFIVGIMMWAKICQARGKSPLLVLGIIFLPIIFIPYLAFSE